MEALPRALSPVGVPQVLKATPMCLEAPPALGGKAGPVVLGYPAPTKLSLTAEQQGFASRAAVVVDGVLRVPPSPRQPHVEWAAYLLAPFYTEDGVVPDSVLDRCDALHKSREVTATRGKRREVTAFLHAFVAWEEVMAGPHYSMTIVLKVAKQSIPHVMAYRGGTATSEGGIPTLLAFVTDPADSGSIHVQAVAKGVRRTPLSSPDPRFLRVWSTPDQLSRLPAKVGRWEMVHLAWNWYAWAPPKTAHVKTPESYLARLVMAGFSDSELRGTKHPGLPALLLAIQDGCRPVTGKANESQEGFCEYLAAAWTAMVHALLESDASLGRLRSEDCEGAVLEISLIVWADNGECSDLKLIVGPVRAAQTGGPQRQYKAKFACRRSLPWDIFSVLSILSLSSVLSCPSAIELVGCHDQGAAVPALGP